MTKPARGATAASILCAVSATALTAGLAGTAYAQETADVGAVVVTASRIQAAGFTAPTPTTVLGAAELNKRAPVSVLETINDVPSFRPSSTPQNSSSPTNGANSGAGSSLVDLRGLGSARTLTLIDGRRTGGTQDLNQIPTILTSRIDVVTGGASAAYGSDAVAGVVNIILDTKFTGLKGEAQYGQTKYGDDETWKAAVAWGGRFFNDRAHLLIGGEYSDEKGAVTTNPPYQDPRPWIARESYLQVVNPCSYFVTRPTTACPTGSNGLSPYYNGTGVRFSTTNAGGLITAGPLKGITFEDGGVPRQFQYGVVMGNNMVGGDPSGAYNVQFNLRPKMKRYAALAHLDFDINSKLRLWLEYNNAQTRAQVNVVPPRDQGTLRIRSGNPFIPAVIQADMTRLNLSTISMGRLNVDGGQSQSHVDNDIYRFAGGFTGELGGGWSWDAHAQYGIFHQHLITYGSRDKNRWAQALDAVRGPNGTIVCRNPFGGCVPFNVFGPNAASQAAIDFVRGVQSADRDTTQTNLTFNLHGEPVSTWAGPVAVALGGEYRREHVNTTSDPRAQMGVWDSGNIKPLEGAYDVKEGYVEVAVPLARDMTLARSLDLNGAIRYAKYSTAGGATTWKIGGTWEPIDEILLRSTYSRDIRAPNNNELYQAGGTSINNIQQFQGPFAGQAVLTNYVQAGNTALTPEKADTWTAGFSLRPKFARLRFSADYFNIKIKDAIGNIGGQNIVNLCAGGDKTFCNLLTFDGQGTVTAVLNTFVNANQFRTRGWDFEASYTQPLGDLWSALPGTLTARAFATKVLEYANIDANGYVDRHGQNTPQFAGTLNVPEWVANYYLTYDVGRLTGGVQFRYIGPGVLETTSITGTPTERFGNNVPSQTLTNFSASYRLIDAEGRRLTLFGAVNNAFNKGPPGTVYSITQAGYGYDSLGMVWRAGLRFSY